jgi:type IX secretion system PorP/SprF family membrane protein
MKILKTFFLFILPVPFFATGQNTVYTQTMANPMYFNPAFAGIQQNFRAALQYRNELLFNQVSTTASAEIGVNKINSGIGFVFTNDNEDGIVSGNSMSINYAYEAKISETAALRFGASVSFYRRSLNFGYDSINPKTGYVGSPDIETTPFIPAFGLGALYYTKNFYAGFAINNLTQPDENVPKDTDQTYRRYVLQLGGFINLGPLILNPYILAQNSPYVSSQFLPGINVRWKYFTLGSSIRITDAHFEYINLLAGLSIGKFKLCYSYDYRFAFGPIAPSGAHELSLVFQLSKPHDTVDKPMIGYLRNAF